MGINRERDWTLEFKRGAMQLGQGAVMGFATGMVVGGCIGSLYVIISGPAPGKTIMATVATQMFQTEGPRLNETLPLTYIYHATLGLKVSIKKLKDRPTSTSRANEVHAFQKVLLDSFFLIYAEMKPIDKAPRLYYSIIPQNDLQELNNSFNETVLFQAQSIALGFLEGLALITALKDAAVDLYATYEATRDIINERTLKNCLPPYDDLYPQMKIFDAAWAKFEEHLCIWAYSGTRAKRKRDDILLYQNVMSETLQHCIQKEFIKREQIIDSDPSLMISLPRLMIINSLTLNQESIPMTNPKNDLNWFRKHYDILYKLQNQLNELNEMEMDYLQKRLSFVEDLKEIQNGQVIEEIYRQICHIAGTFHASELNAVLHRVFKVFQ
ncbi:hypothetical protein HDV02_003955 [Globomyces sp. JEL0801]|nr:hypothetical protein HDV02_003955 [Globomyces sp. JEL0801]